MPPMRSDLPIAGIVPPAAAHSVRNQHHRRGLGTRFSFAAVRVARCVLIDRGHRQLPMAASLVGRVVAPRQGEAIAVKLREIDNTERVPLMAKAEELNPNFCRSALVGEEGANR